jgi:hypothetical protein
MAIEGRAALPSGRFVLVTGPAVGETVGMGSSRMVRAVLLVVVVLSVVAGSVVVPADAVEVPAAIVSPPPASGVVDVPYEHAFEATPSGGHWSLTSGSLPSGMHLSGDGVLDGVPEVPGAYRFEVTVGWSGVVELAAGAYHSCVRLDGAGVSCWGGDPNGADADQAGPFTSVAAGAYHTCGLTIEGAVDCWGSDIWGQAIDHVGPYTAVEAGGARTCALDPAGAADCWGYDAAFGGGEYQALAVGSTHICGLTLDGKARCTNGDRDGPFTALAAGYGHTCGLTPAGAADCWGLDSRGQAGDRLGPFTAVMAGLYFSCGLRVSGAIECWGDDGYRQIADAPEGTFSLIDAGSWHACALSDLGDVVCWGHLDEGQPAGEQLAHQVSQEVDLTITGACEVPSWPFADVGADHRFCGDIAWMWRQGVARGWPDGTFRPTAPVTRQAVAAFLHRLAGSPVVELPETPTFLDVGPADPFYAEVEWMAAVALSTGYVDGGFHPTASMSRQAFAAFLHRLAGSPVVELPVTPTFLDVGPANPFYAEVEWMAVAGLSAGFGDDRYHPTEPLSRQAFAAFLHRFDSVA